MVTARARRERVLGADVIYRPTSHAWSAASDDASYITGQSVYVEGGRLGLNYTMT